VPYIPKVIIIQKVSCILWPYLGPFPGFPFVVFVEQFLKNVIITVNQWFAVTAVIVVVYFVVENGKHHVFGLHSLLNLSKA